MTNSIMTNVSVSEGNEFDLRSEQLHESSKISIEGKNNRVIVYPGVTGRLMVRVHGDNSQIIIDQDVKIFGILDIVIRRSQSTVFVGSENSFQGKVRMHLHETSSISTGSDCMFSGDILLTTSDMHPVFNLENERINQAKSIKLGDHIWVGEGARILKGVEIGSGSIVGISSVVTANTFPSRVVIAGNPAKVRKTGITWNRQFNKI